MSVGSLVKVIYCVWSLIVDKEVRKDIFGGNIFFM